MDSLVKRINYLRNTEIGSIISERMEHFREKNDKETEEWFSEMCFCLLTANSTARLGISIQNDIGFDGFFHMPQTELSGYLKDKGHRFWNKRSEFIGCAREHRDIKSTLSGMNDPAMMRDWLVQNVKGLGFKEASHFLRNTGHNDVAIIDRHVLDVMHGFGLIKEKPSSLTPKKYMEFENKLKVLADKVGMSLAELDLYLWYMKTGEVLK
ncbi:MAG: N-glycosylase/DNA lyase [Candidatus Aenigmarchaeota archaeon]|nr:N-glycosylase/DNA lyase [Candidatus Aenigmarchaeota archaeon]